MSVSATARFTVTVDVPIDTWNETENFARLREIAIKEGLPKLRHDMKNLDYRIIGEPKVIAMMAAEER